MDPLITMAPFTLAAYGSWSAGRTIVGAVNDRAGGGPAPRRALAPCASADAPRRPDPVSREYITSPGAGARSFSRTGFVERLPQRTFLTLHSTRLQSHFSQ